MDEAAEIAKELSKPKLCGRDLLRKAVLLTLLPVGDGGGMIRHRLDELVDARVEGVPRDEDGPIWLDVKGDRLFEYLPAHNKDDDVWWLSSLGREVAALLKG